MTSSQKPGLFLFCCMKRKRNVTYETNLVLNVTLVFLFLFCLNKITATPKVYLQNCRKKYHKLRKKNTITLSPRATRRSKFELREASKLQMV